MKTTDELIREHYSKIGKKGGETNKQKGSEYFKWVRSFGKQKKRKRAEMREKGL